jgi:tetratricopeptide (TPR) repeat protein
MAEIQMKKGFSGFLLFLLVGVAAAHAADPCLPAGEWLSGGQDHLRQGGYNEALAMLDKALVRAPRCAQAFYSRGLVLDKMGRYDRAIEEYSLAIAADPGDAAAYYRRGLDFGRKGHFDRETEDYSKATALVPDIEQSARGTEKWNDGEIEAFTKAIAEDPGDAWAYYSRGIALRLKGRAEEAAEDFRKALALDPEHIWAIYHLGAALRTLNRLDEAVVEYDRAFSIDAALAWAAYNRGLILSRQGRYAAAIADFRRTLGLDPNYTRSVEQHPNYAWAYYDRGFAYLKQKQYKPAIADFTKAAAIAPAFPPLYYWRAMAYSGIGKKEKTREDMRRAARLGSPAAGKWLADRTAAARRR